MPAVGWYNRGVKAVVRIVALIVLPILTAALFLGVFFALRYLVDNIVK
jgi:hypothetical protein